MNTLQIIRFNFVILHPENKDNTNKSPKTGGCKNCTGNILGNQ